MPPTIAPATVATRDDFDDVFDGLVEVFGGEVVVVLKCMSCIGILRTEVVSLGKSDMFKTHFSANGANIAPCAGLTRNTVTLVDMLD